MGSNTEKPEERRAGVLVLSYLVPFMLIKSLNVPALFKSEGRQSANNTNGIIVLSLLDMAVLHSVWVLIAMPLGASYPTRATIPIVIYLTLCLVHLAWLSGARVESLIGDFKSKPRPVRLLYTGLSIVAFGLAIFTFFNMTPLLP